MNTGRIAMSISYAEELRRLDHVLDELTRPGGRQTVPEMLLPELRDLGVIVDANATRKELVERLWSRKRSLIGQISAFGGPGGATPVA